MPWLSSWSESPQRLTTVAIDRSSERPMVRGPMKFSTKAPYHFPVAILLRSNLLAVQAALGLRTEDAIRQARRGLKRVRAAAAFVGKPRPTWLQCLERDARLLHRELGVHRDCTVVAEYAAKLSRGHPDSVSMECLAALSSREALPVPEPVWADWDRRVGELLAAVEVRKATPIVDSAEALGRSFRRARRARVHAAGAETVDAHHNLRKALQRLLAQIELLPGGPVGDDPKVVADFAQAARRLGRAGNLEMLEAALLRQTFRTTRERKALGATLKWLRARRQRLWVRALAACAGLKTRDPGKFARSIVRARA